MKTKQIWFNSAKNIIFFKQKIDVPPPANIKVMPESKEVTGYYDNALIGILFARFLLGEYLVNKIIVKQEFVEIDFYFSKKIAFKTLKEKTQNNLFEKIQEFDWKKENGKTLEVIFENWPVIKNINTLNFEAIQIDEKLLNNTKINNYSSFTNKDGKTIYRLQLKIPVVEFLLPTDHRKTNQTLKIFRFINEIGPGLPFWLPKGETVKHEIKTYLRKLEKDNGFIFVNTPPIANKKIYETSGHLEHYEEYMFPTMERNQEFFVLRPMTCPHHCLFFASEIRSYSDLPMRVSENSLLYRYETSGSLSGLERVRQMELKDTHIFLQKDSKQIKTEIQKCYRMTQAVLKAMGIQIKRIYLSVHEPKEFKKYYNDSKLWAETEAILKEGLDEIKVDYKVMKGEAAFYGPKIDLQINNALNHDVTISTIQLDFLLAQRFKLTYRTAEPSKSKREVQPIIIHHGIIGTYERLIATLLENNNGWLPFWLSPIQVAIIPMQNNDKVSEYNKKIYELLYKYNIRTKIMKTEKSVNANIKKTWLEKIPFHIFIGAEEESSQVVTFSDYRQSKIKEKISALQLVDRCLNLIEKHQ